MLISNNGVLTHSDDKLFCVSHRITKYGDGFFESIKLFNRKPQLFQLHYDRLIRASKLFHLPMKDKWTQAFFEEHLEWLCLKNGWSNARCRIVFYRDSEGFYTPNSDRAGFVIEMTEGDKSYVLNDIGFKMGAYTQILKASNFTSFFKNLSSINYVLAGIYARDNKFDSVFLFNEFGNISEAFNANVFLINGNDVSTPALSEYCVDGVMRQHIILSLKNLDYNIFETSISEEDLLQAEEVFLTNAIRGIIWVESYKQSIYDFKKVFAIHSQIF